MSTRFYINGVQIFGNGDMYENTRQELIKQIGIDCYEEEYFHDKEQSFIKSSMNSFKVTRNEIEACRTQLRKLGRKVIEKNVQ